MNTLTLHQFCTLFGCTLRQAEQLRTKNKAQLEAMYHQACATRKRVNGYTSEQLRQLLVGLQIPKA